MFCWFRVRLPSEIMTTTRSGDNEEEGKALVAVGGLGLLVSSFFAAAGAWVRVLQHASSMALLMPQAVLPVGACPKPSDLMPTLHPLVLPRKIPMRPTRRGSPTTTCLQSARCRPQEARNSQDDRPQVCFRPICARRRCSGCYSVMPAAAAAAADGQIGGSLMLLV